jgi:hypothetical protein
LLFSALPWVQQQQPFCQFRATWSFRAASSAQRYLLDSFSQEQEQNTTKQQIELTAARRRCWRKTVIIFSVPFQFGKGLLYRWQWGILSRQKEQQVEILDTFFFFFFFFFFPQNLLLALQRRLVRSLLVLALLRSIRSC